MGVTAAGPRCVRLLTMSAASISQLSTETTKGQEPDHGVSVTTSFTAALFDPRFAGPAMVEAEPKFFEGDTVAHCGRRSKGELAHT